MYMYIYLHTIKLLSSIYSLCGFFASVNMPWRLWKRRPSAVEVELRRVFPTGTLFEFRGLCI